MAYWDAQIWASAKMNQIPVVFSEDFGDGVIIEGVRFVNPFSAGFNLETWLLGSRSIYIMTDEDVGPATSFQSALVRRVAIHEIF
jgi:hypothetical protein